MIETHVENIENKPEDKKRIKSSILEHFGKLSHGQEKVRITNGVKLIKYLVTNENSENGDHEVKYALERLIRGVGASKINARCGFYSTLVSLLNTRSIPVTDIFDVIDKQLHKSGSNSKSENADIGAGRILVCGALLRSTIFASSSIEDQSKIILTLLNAGKERTYLQLASYYFIIGTYENITEKDFKKIILPLLQPELVKPFAEYDLDTLFLLLVTKKKYPTTIAKHILKKLDGINEVIEPQNFRDLANILMTVPRIALMKHPAYEFFVKELVETDHAVEFMEILDDTLSRSNRNKHLLAINLLTLILQNSKNPNNVARHLNKNLIQQTLNAFRQIKGKEKDNEFKQLAQKLFETILNQLKLEDIEQESKLAVLKKLLFYPGTFIFEKITKSKLVQQITGILDKEGVKQLATIYREVILLENEKFVSENDSDRWLNNDRLYATHLLVKLMNHSAMVDEGEWKFEELRFLMHLGLLKKEERVGCELAGALKETFFRALELKLSKLEDLCNILSKLFHDFDSVLTADNFTVILRTPIPVEAYETWTKTKQIIEKIESKKTKKVRLVFRTLFLHMGLQLLNDVNLAADSLNELFSCYDRIKKKQNHIENSEDPAWIEVVTELFLNLLSHNSHLLRSVINCVFPHLCKYLNATSIHQILSILDPKNENPLSNKNDVSDSESSDDDDEDDDEIEGEEYENDAQISEDENEDETPNDKLRMALQKALMPSGAKSDDEESVDLDQLSDGEGEKLNEALAEAFKLFKPNRGRKSKKQSKDDQTLTHFRIRVLDLIDIYVDSNPSMHLVLEIMLPLLQILEFSIRDDHQKPLQDRVKSSLKKLTNLKKYSDIDGVDDKLLSELLTSLLEKGTKNNVLLQEMGEEIAQCSTFIIKCSQYLINTEDVPKKVKKHLKRDIPEIIKSSLEIYFKKRDCYIPYVLFKQTLQLNWIGILELASLLTDLIFQEDIRPFRRNQAEELLKIFYTNHRFLNSPEETVKARISEEKFKLLNLVKDFFKRLIEDPIKMKIKEKFISNLFKLLTGVKSSPIKTDEFDWKDLVETVKEYRSYLNLSIDTKQSYSKLCSCIGISNLVQMKATTIKLGNIQGDDNSSIASSSNNKKTKKKHKQKLNEDKLKLKKETRELRLQSLSQGLNVDFGDVDDVRKMEIEDSSSSETTEVQEVQTNGEVKSKKRKRKNKDGIVKKKKN